MKYKLNKKRKEAYLAIGLLALMGFCGCMNTQDLEHMQEVEESNITVEYVPVEQSPSLYDIPLDKNLQDFVIETAKDYGIEPELVFAVIEKESNFNPDAIGDGGDSKGLMQIQEKWHEKRMNKLGVETLMNPYSNVLVGVDILAEQIEKHGEIGGLVAYNQGYYNGKVTNYAKTVMEIKESLNGDRQQDS